MSYVIVRYLHFIAIAVFAIALVIENVAIKAVINKEDAQNLAKVDRVCGLALFCILLFGLGLWFLIGKPADFYSGNVVFQIKVGLFIVLVALATFPALFFHRHRNIDVAEIVVPASIPRILKLEFALLIIIPLFASLAARGVGLSVN